ncbi:MAG: prephenate dehydrogenase/arogenate dehydrogenase family protein [Gammaproteobacteria bacterium]|jgi:prephenate dehydrogenase|nr:prephenate dehydrogenase/arogenate dehydrogenase family protein [Gammaproteobacteria bacterium]
MTAKVQTVCIIGTGLIGGSLALALKQAGFCRHVIGAGRTEATLQKAVELGVIDHYEMDYAVAVKDADVVVVAVPLSAMKNVFEQIAPALSATAVVTDAGSAKQSVIKDAELALAKNFKRFVAGHPISGTEKSGVTAALVDLYKNRKVILTPTDRADADAVKLVTEMWQAAGAEVESMSARHHDLVLAGTSHLPHILAFGLVDCLNNLEGVDEVFRFAAGGFRDFTRIASSDPVMWRDICLSNREDIFRMLEKYQQQLQTIHQALQDSDGEALINIFARAKQARDQFNNK